MKTHLRRKAALLALLPPLALGACGRPQAPDIRSEMATAITNLSLRPVFPLSETMRLGTVVLVDGSVGLPGGRLPAFQETSLLVTEDLVGPFESARRARATVRRDARLAQSPSGMNATLRPAATGGGAAFFRQTAAADTDRAPEHSLTLAALPGFTLASVDQFSFAGFIPNQLASFFGALGLRNTSFMRMEAEGIEVAEVPLQTMLETIVSACRSAAFLDRVSWHQRAVAHAYDLFEAQRRERESLRLGSVQPVQPYLHMVRRVFYLRGIRFILDDSRAAAAFAQAALQQQLPAGTSAVTLPAVTVNTNVSPPVPSGTTVPSGSAGAAEGASAARITALQQQVDGLRQQLAANGSNIQIAGSLARATATGVELVQAFDRPLAFGYQSLSFPLRGTRHVIPGTADVATTSTGLAPLCAEAGVNLP